MGPLIFPTIAKRGRTEPVEPASVGKKMRMTTAKTPFILRSGSPEDKNCLTVTASSDGGKPTKKVPRKKEKKALFRPRSLKLDYLSLMIFLAENLR